ncbi:MAG: hypothetical protein HZB14_08355 [Actinobacteria bacterium]|nr:hypothetical protein [Actinomycetota bacterium]
MSARAALLLGTAIVLALSATGCGDDNAASDESLPARPPLTVPDASVAAEKSDDDGSTDTTGETGDTTSGTDTGSAGTGTGTGTDTGGTGTGTGGGTGTGTDTTTPQDTGGAAPGN